MLLAGNTVQAIPQVDIDLANVSGYSADEHLRPGVVAYGLGRTLDSQFHVLSQYLDATGASAGDVILDSLGLQLRQLTELSTSSDFDAELDSLLDGIIQETVDRVNAVQAGGRVQFLVFCSLPDHLAHYAGILHDAQNGLLFPTEHTISACGPIDQSGELLSNGLTPQQEWSAIMQKVAEYFAGQNVYFVIGSEPANYFNGDFDQFLEFAEFTASGLRLGDPGVEIGILSNDDLRNRRMLRTNPVFVPEDPEDPEDDPNGRYEMSTVVYDKPLVELYLEHIQNNGLDKIDAIQYKQFLGSPFPANSAFWIKDAEYVNTLIENLGPVNNATNGPVRLYVTDYPGWHTKCDDDIETIGAWAGGESIWDSEYIAAMYTSAYLGMAQMNHLNLDTGVLAHVEKIEPHLAFLINWGEDTFFHSSCESDASEPAGFGGSIALNSKSSEINKSVSHVLNMLAGIEGNLLRVKSSSDNIVAYSGYSDAPGEPITLVLSHFVPTESMVNTYSNTEGEPSYELGHLWNNEYDIPVDLSRGLCPGQACTDPLKLCCTAQAFQDLVYDPEGYFPRNMTRALIVEDADPSLWNLPDALAARFAAVKQAGQVNRAIPESRGVRINLNGLSPSTNYRFTLNSIDQQVGNAYTDRYLLDGQITSQQNSCELSICFGQTGMALNSCMKQCVQPVIDDIKSQYTFASTEIVNGVVAASDAEGNLSLTLPNVKRNSVHMVRATRL